MQIAKGKSYEGNKSKSYKETLDFNEENLKFDPMKRLTGGLRNAKSAILYALRIKRAKTTPRRAQRAQRTLWVNKQ